jgi:hypothetical protein
MVPDWKTGKLTRALGDDATWMVLADNDPRFQPFAVQTARHAGFVAYETSDQAWAQWATRGLTYHGWMPATPIELRIWSPQVTVRLNTTGQKQVVPITTTTIDFATTRPGTLDAVYVNGDLVPLKEHNGRARLILSKQQNDGQNQDWRLLRSPRNLAHGNMHVEKIRVRPPMLPSP